MIALARGAPTGVRTTAMPLASATCAKRAVLAVVIAQEEAGPFPVWRRLPQLLGHPVLAEKPIRLPSSSGIARVERHR